MENYDYIILGGGCAGLSLAFHMKKGGIKGKRILILEEKRKVKNDRTWCFWSAEKPELGSLQSKNWQKMGFESSNFRKVEQLDELSYHYIKGSDYYKEIRLAIADDPMFEYKEERVERIIKKENGVQIISTHQQYEATWVFNSIPFQPPKSKKDIWLKQHFYGYFLETETNSFDPEEVMFMDFNTPYENAFFYVLPLSPTRALVEFTVFSSSVWSENIYKQQLEDYLREKKGIEQYTITEIEKGVIPMTSYVFPKMENERVMNIGTRGGMTKPTTGYTFIHIQEDSRKIVEQLLKTGSPIYKDTRKKRYRFYDNLLLDIIKHEPDKLKLVMTTLFKRNNIPTILRFLDEKTSLTQELWLLLRLPWLPFFRAIYRFYLHGKTLPTTQPDIRITKPPYPLAKSSGILPVD